MYVTAEIPLTLAAFEQIFAELSSRFKGGVVIVGFEADEFKHHWETTNYILLCGLLDKIKLELLTEEADDDYDFGEDSEGFDESDGMSFDDF